MFARKKKHFYSRSQVVLLLAPPGLATGRRCRQLSGAETKMAATSVIIAPLFYKGYFF